VLTPDTARLDGSFETTNIWRLRPRNGVSEVRSGHGLRHKCVTTDPQRLLGACPGDSPSAVAARGMARSACPGENRVWPSPASAPTRCASLRKSAATSRDTRFSKDKRPYKTHLDPWFWQGAGRSHEAAGYFFRLTRTTLYLGRRDARIRAVVAEQYREAVVDEKRGRALASAVEAVTAAGAELGGATKKRVPRGFDPDRERADLLVHSGLYAGHELSVPPEAHAPAFPAFWVDRLERLPPPGLGRRARRLIPRRRLRGYGRRR
jgi:uncharacterized protein (DUF2461 family)